MFPISHVHTELSPIYKGLFECAARAHLVAARIHRAYERIGHIKAHPSNARVTLRMSGKVSEWAGAARPGFDRCTAHSVHIQCIFSAYSVHLRKCLQECQGKQMRGCRVANDTWSLVLIHFCAGKYTNLHTCSNFV